MNSIPAEIVDEIDHDLSRAQEQIMTWKAHCVRTVHQDQAKQTVLGNLKPHQALIVMDWAMKFLPVRHREAQSDFFGKKGVSWHVSSVVTLDIEAEPEFKTNFNVHTLVHILELGNQGWFSVAHIITDLLQKLPLILPLVTEIFLKSDNAGCYHCVPLISYIQNINVNGGLPVKILQYNFSEAQSGKDICDAKTSHCKMHILRYSGEGHDVLSAEDMSTALNSNGVKGVFNAVVAIDQNHQTKTKTKIPNISAMNNFEFYSEGVKVRRAYGIGNGNFIPNLQFKDNKLMEGFQVIIPFSNFVADHHGRVVLARNNIDVEHENMGNDNDTENNGNENVTETVENEMEEDVRDDGLFACPDQSCTKVFTKPHFLEAHIVIGNHVYSTSENSYDSVKLIWAQQCEAVDREHKVLIQSVSSINMNVNEGWALKLNKPFKRFTKKVKDFLFDIYVKCESSGRRPNFDTLATELKTTRHENDGTKMFTREEWLSSSQIRSLFANFVRLGAETSLKSEDTAVIENILEEIDSLEYHNNMTELATDVVQQFL
ncbi:uncharacterized protein [Mytilus edulis]|uniref:uncharacterized protein n=1 Tax=Mytilus edulis TaxID=6550 RepID=UPI0039F072E1